MRNGLQKTKENLTMKVNLVLSKFTRVDEKFLEKLEEILIISDIGAEVSAEICNVLRVKMRENGLKEPQQIKEALKDIIAEALDGNNDMKITTKPSIIVVFGVNGVGKTTTIGKMAANFVKSGKKVTIAAADTFRAAAIEQLQILAEISGSTVIRRNAGSDPGSVIFDAISYAKTHGTDIIICDTAGRLHNKSNLMAELGKIGKIVNRGLPDADKEFLLVVDATTGQNALSQAIEFKKILDITGIIVTKLDGTAKGGIILAIKKHLKIPIKYIGLGEKIDDLQPFEAKRFAEALFFGNED
jgi:fused signal recognition particle receptor